MGRLRPPRFTRASSITVSNRVKNCVMTYRYRYFGDWDNLKIYPGSRAYHGVDLNMWHGVAQDVSGLPSSKAEDKLSKYIIKALTTFADDPENGLHKKLGWPKYKNSTGELLNPRF